jgi:hypothetical protein
MVDTDRARNVAQPQPFQTRGRDQLEGRLHELVISRPTRAPRFSTNHLVDKRLDGPRTQQPMWRILAGLGLGLLPDGILYRAGA